MNDVAFNKLTECVAGMFPHRNPEKEIERLKNNISDDGEWDNKHATIESNVWGWRILWPAVGFSSVVVFGGKHKGGFSVLSEGLSSLDDAVKVCDAFKMPYKVMDTQDPDPL